MQPLKMLLRVFMKKSLIVCLCILLFSGCVVKKQNNSNYKKNHTSVKKIKVKDFNNKSSLFSTKLDSEEQKGLFKVTNEKIKFRKSKLEKTKRSIKNLDMSN